jgi:hypothetical protein
MMVIAANIKQLLTIGRVVACDSHAETTTLQTLYPALTLFAVVLLDVSVLERSST